MLTKYKTHGGRAIKIIPVEVDRQTESSVWIKGRRRARRTDWDTYHDSWEHAQYHLIQRETTKVETCTVALKDAQDRLSAIKELTPEKIL